MLRVQIGECTSRIALRRASEATAVYGLRARVMTSAIFIAFCHQSALLHHHVHTTYKVVWT